MSSSGDIINKVFVCNLSNLLKSEPLTMKRFSESLKIRGYAYVKLPPILVKQIDTCVGTINNFFNYDVQYKKKFMKKPIFGYFDAKHKESFRLLTGKRLAEHRIPQNFESIQKLSNLSDRLMHKISKNASSYLFPNLEEQSILYDIPLFDQRNYWGMLDATIYKNNGTKKGLNCD
jgi:hypothetical protein